MRASDSLEPRGKRRRRNNECSRDTPHRTIDEGRAPEAGEAYAWHFDMLHDEARLTAFAESFRRLPPDALRAPALDIGCGSGVLGLSLLRCRPETPCVVALEVDTAVAEVAAMNVRRAKLPPGRIQVHARRSTTVDCLRELLPQGSQSASAASLVVCEILDAGLLGEDCLGTLRHASENLLQSGYYAVPASAQVFACGVESATLRSWQHLSERLGSAKRDAWAPPPEYIADHGDGNPHDVFIDRLVEAGEAKVLSAEFRAFHIDFESLPPASGRTSVIDLEITADGHLDAIVFWWGCQMVRSDQDTQMTNAPAWAPSASHLRGRREIDHWRQSVCVLPKPTLQVARGQRVRLVALHNDEDIWFRVLGESDALPSPANVPKATTRVSLLSQSRLWMLSDYSRMCTLRRAVVSAISHLHFKPWAENGGALVLDLSDGPLLSLEALRALKRHMRTRSGRGRRPLSKTLRTSLRLCGRGRPTVLCLESTMEDMWLATDLVSLWHHRDGRAGVAPGCAPRLQIEMGSPALAPGSVGLLCAEPYARSVDGHPCDAQLWQHFAQVDALRWALKPNVQLVPQRFRVYAALVSCAELWRRRQPCSDPVCAGVDVCAVNRLHPDPLVVLGSSDGFSAETFRERFACGLWQVEHVINSEAAVICDVSLRQPFPRRRRLFPEVRLAVGEICLGVHAIATWTEVEAADGLWLPSAAPCMAHSAELRSVDSERHGALRFRPSYNLQGVMLALNPLGSAKAAKQPELQVGRYVSVAARFHPADGSLRLSARWDDCGLAF